MAEKVLDFLIETGIPAFNSRAKIKNLIKSNGISIDKQKVTEPEAEIEACLCYVDCIDLGEFLFGTEFYDVEALDGTLRKFFYKLGFNSFKENELLGVMFDNYFVVSKGKKEHWLIRTNKIRRK